MIETTTGVKYSFRDEDAGQAKRMLKALGLAESRKVFDLAAARHQRDDFHRQRGLTFRLVANDANALRTAGAGGGRPKFAPLTGTSDRFRDMDDGDPLNLGNDAVRDE